MGIAVAKSGAEGGASERVWEINNAVASGARQTCNNEPSGTRLILLGPVLVANLLCPRREERRTMHKLQAQIGTSGHNLPKAQAGETECNRSPQLTAGDVQWVGLQEVLHYFHGN